ALDNPDVDRKPQFCQQLLPANAMFPVQVAEERLVYEGNSFGNWHRPLRVRQGSKRGIKHCISMLRLFYKGRGNRAESRRGIRSAEIKSGSVLTLETGSPLSRGSSFVHPQ